MRREGADGGGGGGGEGIQSPVDRNPLETFITMPREKMIYWSKSELQRAATIKACLQISLNSHGKECVNTARLHTDKNPKEERKKREEGGEGGGGGGKEEKRGGGGCRWKKKLKLIVHCLGRRILTRTKQFSDNVTQPR